MRGDGAGGGGEKGLLGHVEVGIDLTGYLPGDGILHIKEASELTGVLDGRGHAEGLDLEDLGLDGDVGVADGVAADDDDVGVEGLGDADGGGAGGFEVGGEAEVVEGVLAVVGRDGEVAGGGEALVEGVGEGVAVPGEIGLGGAVVEGEDEDYVAVAGGGALGEDGKGAENNCEGEAKGGSETEHRMSIAARLGEAGGIPPSLGLSVQSIRKRLDRSGLWVGYSAMKV